ncbi:PAS domain S-box protein [Bacillus sp. FJAT-45350]|uniref:PAS domain S-box protein n=1 Tax=Bacillus sp. FJAT-45350 TaxID=2011014 RepID=UPI000BB8AA5E|nr:PAS domain S-box protein [Bacillus sp. FJAT-45350]
MLPEVAIDKHNLYKTAFQTASIGMGFATSKGVLLEVNNTFCELFGCTENELINSSYKELTHPDDIYKNKQLYNDIQNKKINSFQIEKRYIHKNGDIIWAIVDVAVINNSEILSIQIQDISKMKSLEQKYRTWKENSLIESEKRYRTIVESSSDAIGIHCDEKLVYVNSAFLQQFGAKDESEIIGKCVKDFLLPESYKVFKSKLVEMENDKSKKVFSNYKVKTLDGEIRKYESTSASIYYKDKLAVQFINRDVTEKKKYEEFLQKSDKLSVVGELAAGVAHEIRNPLTTIKGFIQLFKIYQEFNEEHFTLIETELNRVERIIYEFLTLAKPHQGMNLAENDLSIILEEVLTLEKTSAILKGIEIDLNVVGPTPLICDSNALKQVFINILQNSIDAVESNGKIVIDVIQNIKDSSISIQFKDNGCGIPKDRIHKLGEPFYTLKEKGTGIGLMVSFKIIENHQGSIHISSEEGEGTTVEVVLSTQLNNL